MAHEGKEVLMPAFFRSCWSTPVFDDYCGFKYYCSACKHYSRELYEKDEIKSSSLVSRSCCCLKKHCVVQKITGLKRCYPQCVHHRDFNKEAAEMLADAVSPAPQSVDLDKLRDVVSDLMALLRQKSQ
jgi:hypothetical protein